MPLSRYKVRNEYSLADPELYRAADKDDPEALLEGVAMAGLVGVLRQLGDLAEFAAEIFHDLHEEVMATAARGHGLLIRVQQLESEFPSIERAFLSQTGHSAFFSNPGIDWHPNLQTEQNLITKGDLPRFVMDSYEECRGPPRLFLLDKFDVAGAGACLKRYTDPSFYKVEASSYEMETAKTQRDKKIIKTKKKGSKWKNGGTPEVLQPAHVKLHQLFLEERVQNGVTEPARRVKLKNRPNKFPFDTENGRNYMEKLLQSPSQDKLVHEVPIVSSPFRLPSDNAGGSELEILEVLSQNERMEPTDNASENIVESLGLVADSVSSELHEEIDDKHVAVDGEIKADAIQDGYRSDDVASEIDNYVDALNTMESEIETDTEPRAKTDPSIKLQSQFSDSQSIGNSTASDDGNNSVMKGTSHFSYSDSTSISADNTSPAGVDSPPQAFACIEIPFHPRVPPNQLSDTEKIRMTQNPDNEGALLKESTSMEAGLNEISSNYSEDHDCSSKIEEHKIDLEDTYASTYKLADIPSPTTDSSSSLSVARNPETEVANEDPNASFSPIREISGNSLRKVIQTGYGEDNSSRRSFDSQCSSPNSVISHVQEQPIVPSSEPEIDPDENPSEATYRDNIPVVEETLAPDTCSLSHGQLQEIGDVLVVHKSDSAEASGSYSSDYEAEIEEKETESINSETTVLPDAVDRNGDNGCFTLKNETESVDRETSVNNSGLFVTAPVSVPDDVDKNEDKDLSTVEDDTDLVEGETELVNSKTEAGVTAFTSIGVDKNEDNGLSTVEEPDEHVIHDSKESGEKKEVDKHSVISPEMFSDASENDSESPSANLKILQDEGHGFLDDADQNGPQAVVSPDLDSRPGDIAPSDHSNVQVLDGACDPTEAETILLPDIVTAVSSSSKYIDRDLESKSLNQSYHVDEFEASSSISSHLNPLESKVDQPIDQINLQSLESAGNSQLESRVLVQEEELQLEQCAVELTTTGVATSNSSVSESVLELPQTSSNEVNLSDEVKHQSTPLFSGFTLLPQLAPISLEEMPPLPPLPPMQWRMGKLQNASRTDGGQHKVDHLPPFFPSKSHDEPQIVGYPTLENPKSEHSYEDLGGGVVSFSQTLSIEDSLHTEKHDEASTSSEANAVKFAENMAGSAVEMDQSCNVSTSGQEVFRPSGTSSLPLIDDERPNGIRPMKIHRPRSPLIDAVVAHDKSKLRKASERARPQIPKEEERDTLLEQIRAKSFNLKPAVHTRPSIQGPKTNLRVAAILEKANAIRQAFAGSDDDDDDDSWSDS